MSVKIYQGDCIEVLKGLPEQCVNTVVTSPPYYGLRDYGCEGQIGLEESPDAFIEKMVAVFREVRRVLRDDGTIWVNMGDSYCGAAGGFQGMHETRKRSRTHTARLKTKITDGLKSKDLIGVPWMLAFALRADGWYLRQDIIWSKPNPMPESVGDRCTKAHEYVFLLSKSARYYYDADAIREPAQYVDIAGMDETGFKDPKQFKGKNGKGAFPAGWASGGGSHSSIDHTNDRAKKHKNLEVPNNQQPHSMHVKRANNGVGFGHGTDKEARGRGRVKGNAKTFRGGGAYTNGQSFDNDADVARNSHGNTPNVTGMRNKRSVWEVPTFAFPEAHFATYPPALIEPCIKAGCPAGGTVLDPFFGSGTTGIVSDRLQRNCIGIELNPEYIGIADRRLRDDSGMFGDIKIIGGSGGNNEKINHSGDAGNQHVGERGEPG